MAKSPEELIAQQLKKQKIKKPQKRKQGGGQKTAQKTQGITKTKKSVLSKIQARSNARIKRFKIQQRKARERSKEDKKKVKGYFKRKRNETQEQKENRLAKTYLTKKINRLEKQENQSPYTKNLIEELKMTRENIDKTYVKVRDMQKASMEDKEFFIVDTVWSVEYFANEETGLEMEDILVSKSYDELQIILHNEDNLLQMIRDFPPTTYWHATEEEQKNMLEDFGRTVEAFISKYKSPAN